MSQHRKPDPLKPLRPRATRVFRPTVFGAEQSATAQARGASSSVDANAYAVAKRAAPSMPEAERQYVLAVARGEGFYGRGWKPGEGAGSHNWGAVQGTGPAGSFLHLDHHADGTPYHAPFKAYHTDEEGFLDMARILLKPNVKAAVAKGDLQGAVLAQHSNHYFELDPAKYFAAVSKNYAKLTEALRWPAVLTEHKAAAIGTGTAIFIGVAGVLAWKYLKVRKVIG